jgi:hypothetical protein
MLSFLSIHLKYCLLPKVVGQNWLEPSSAQQLSGGWKEAYEFGPLTLFYLPHSSCPQNPSSSPQPPPNTGESLRLLLASAANATLREASFRIRKVSVENLECIKGADKSQFVLLRQLHFIGIYIYPFLRVYRNGKWITLTKLHNL